MTTRVQAVYHAIGDPTRRAMLDTLRKGPLTVNAIADQFPISRPAVSKHLRLLRQSRLLLERKHGRQRLQYLNAKPLREIERWLSTYKEFWSDNLAALKTFVEEAPSTQKRETKGNSQRRR